AESEDATVRRVGVVGPHTRSFPGKPARRDRSRREIWRLDGRGCEARRKPPHATGVGSLLLLAPRHDARNAAPPLLVREPDAATDEPRGREDGAALARPLRHAREQSARYRKMHQQIELFEHYATGNLLDLTIEVAKNPAMLYFLDAQYNVKGAPNENFARE